jgi:hypothetical protein
VPYFKGIHTDNFTLSLRCCDLIKVYFDQKKKKEVGGVEFQCPTCQKMTRVGKKGVSLLHDNVYIRLPATRKAQQDEIYLSDDDRDGDDDDDDDDDDTSTPKTNDAANNRLVLCKY